MRRRNRVNLNATIREQGIRKGVTLVPAVPRKDRSSRQKALTAKNIMPESAFVNYLKLK